MNGHREISGDGGRHLVAKIVSSYVKHNRVAADELQTMIASVHQSLSSLGKAPTSTEPLKPAVHPPIGAPRVCGLPRMWVSRPHAPASSEGRARLRSRDVLRPLEAAS